MPNATFNTRRLISNYEHYLSTQKKEKKENPWLFGKKQDQSRKKSAVAENGKKKKKTNCLDYINIKIIYLMVNEKTEYP